MTPAQLANFRACFTYQPDTGFIVATTSFGRHRRNKAGTRRDYNLHHGYRSVTHEGRQYLAHRVAWLLMTGRWPEAEIDHINGIKSDNRWINLRQATRSENSQNQERPATGKNRTSQFLGVCKPRQLAGKDKPWQAWIKINGKNLWLGNFADEWEAALAYREAKDRLHPTHLRLR